MHSILHKETSVTSALLILALVGGFVFSFGTIAHAQTPGQGAFGGPQQPVGSCYSFTRNYTIGGSGEEVKEIQKFLNKNFATRVAASGTGSPGYETSYFGPATKAAVIKFQNMYASEVLTPAGLASGTGYWGALTRAKANALNANCASGSSTTGSPVKSKAPEGAPDSGAVKIKGATD